MDSANQTSGSLVGLDQNREKNWLGSDKNWLVLGFVVMGEIISMSTHLMSTRLN